MKRAAGLLRLFLALTACLALLAAGCASQPEPVPTTKRPCPVDKLAITPFLSAKPVNTGTGVVCPVTGEIHSGFTVKDKALAVVTAELAPVVETFFNCRVVRPRSMAAYLPPVLSGTEASVRRALAQAGKQAGAQAVLTGVLFRYQDRQGGDIGVTKPASVYFGLYLIDVRNAQVVWQGFFDETQESLSENVLNMSAFIKRGGKWITAAELTRGGYYQVVPKMPSRMPD